MPRNALATHNLVAVSAAEAEGAINQVLAPDVALLVRAEDIINLESRRETNADEATGKEEADTIYSLGGKAVWSPSFDKAQAQHVAFLIAFGLGTVSTASAGATGYQHTITPISSDLDEARSNPSFSAVQRLGNAIAKRLFGSMFVDQITLTCSQDAWVQISAQCKGTGYNQANLVSEEVAGFADDTSVTLSANAVEGSSAAERLLSIHRIEFKATGNDYWQEGTATAVSDATPAALTVTALSGSHTAGTWRVLYVPDEDSSLDTGSATSDPPDDTTGVLTDSAGTMTPDAHIDRWLVMTSGTASGKIWKITDNAATTITCAGINLYSAGVRSGDTYKVMQFGWLPLPSRVSEPPLRVSGLYFYEGGVWDGAAFQGGRLVDAPLTELVWTFNNNLEPEFTAGSGTDAYATRALRSGRSQTLSVNRDCRDWFNQQRLADNEYFGAYALIEGAEYESGHKYQVAIIWPRLAITQAPVGVNNKRLSEGVEIAVLEDDTYGSVIVKVKNKQTGYAG